MALLLLCLVPRLCATSVYSIVPKQGCVVWKHLVPFCPEMASGAGPGHLIFKFSLGVCVCLCVCVCRGGRVPLDSPSWCMLMQAFFHCNWVSCSILKFEAC